VNKFSPQSKVFAPGYADMAKRGIWRGFNLGGVAVHIEDMGITALAGSAR
jgi:hypothetical protein